MVPEYRVELFRRLHRELGIRICHWSGSLSSASNPLGEGNLRAARFRGNTRWHYLFSLPALVCTLLSERPAVVICEASPGFPVFWYLAMLQHILRFRLVGWGHGIDNEDWASGHRGWRFRLQCLLLGRTRGLLLYSHGRATELQRQLGAIPQVVAFNSLDTTGMVEHCNLLQSQGAGRRPLTASEELRLVFVGRLIPGKQLTMALEALAQFSELPWRFRILGDGPAAEALKQQANGDTRIEFLGECHEQEAVGRELASAHLLLHPGNLGLVVVHAMAYGCPVLGCRAGSRGIAHGPEAELLVDGVNGILCAAESKALLAELRALAGDPARLQAMQDAALETARERTGLNQMVSSFCEMLRIQGAITATHSAGRSS